MKPISLRNALDVFLLSSVVALLPAKVHASESTYFLHGDGVAHTLSTDSPTSATGQSVSTGPVDRATLVEIGTWTSAALTQPLADATVHDLHIWLGLRFTTANGRSENSGNSGVFFDVHAQVLKNGSAIATGRVDYVRGLKADPAKADEVVIALANTAATQIQPGDVLALRVYAKVSELGGHDTAPGATLSFDATHRMSRFSIGSSNVVQEFAISSPPNLSYFSSSPITISGTVSNASDTVSVNGVQATISGNNFTALVPLREGNNIITAVATDLNSNITTRSIQVTLDTQAPRVAIDSPRDGAVVSEPRVTVTGLINDTVVGTVNGDQARVEVNGFAATVANRTFLATDIPLVPGTNDITAVGIDRAGNSGSASIEVFYNTNVAPRIQLVSGNHQSGQIGTLLPDPLVVRVTDATSNACPNKKVIFKVTQNDGLIIGPTNTARSLIVLSDANGLAQVQFRLGTRAGAGNNQVSAMVVGFEGEAMFCASATPATPGLLTLDAGNNQAGVVGQPLARPFVTIVVDSGNNRLHNVPITYTVSQGGGSFGGASSKTVNADSDGRALAVLTLGPEPGIENNVVEVTYPGNTGLPVTFVASGKLPADPGQTSISGVVLDNTDLPVPGATMRIDGTQIAVPSDANGFFQIKPAPVGALKLHVDGSTVTRPGTWVNLQYDLNTIAGQDNGIGMPVRLLPMDLAQGLFVDDTHGGTLTLRQAPGYKLTIAPGSVTFPDGTKRGLVSVTVVHPDKIPDVPNFGQQPRFIVSIQPAGAIYNPPAPMCIPNLDGLPPGQKTEMYSFDHDLGSFISIGTGTVTEDGMMVCSDPGVGIIKGGWHCGGNPSQSGQAVQAMVSFTRSSLRSLTAHGSPGPPGNPAYTWQIQSSRGANPPRLPATYNTQDDPNTITFQTVANSGPPIPGGLATVKVTYRCGNDQMAMKMFDVAAFGVSVYIVADEGEFIRPDGTCGSITIGGVTYSGEITNPNGITGTFCRAFLRDVVLQGSGQARDGRFIQYAGSGETNPDIAPFRVVASITGSCGTAVIPNRTIARDTSFLGCGDTIDLDGIGQGLIANDTGNAIRGWRIDLFRGFGRPAAAGWNNPVVMGACNPPSADCPRYAP